MSRLLPTLRPALVTAMNVGLGILTFLGLRTFYMLAAKAVAGDPFAELRSEAQTGIASDVGIRLENVHAKAYHLGKLVTSASSDRLDISKDRQRFLLSGIHDGVYREDGVQYGYEANQGIWRAATRELTVTGSVRVQSADLDLRTTDLVFDEPQHSLRALQDVAGRLYHGSIRAQNFHLDTKTRNFDTGAAEYQGDLAMLQQQGGDADETSSKPWKVSGEYTKAVGNSIFYTKGRAQDDEILVEADLVDQNRKTDVIVATGNVKYFSGKANVSADKATIYHKERRVVLVGHVTIYVKPKSDVEQPPAEEPMPPFQRVTPDQRVAGKLDAPSTDQPAAKTLSPKIPAAGQKPDTSVPLVQKQPTTTVKPKTDAKPTEEEKQIDEDLRNGKSIRHYPMIILCDQVEYWYHKGERHGHVLGSPQAHQELPKGRWRFAWCTTADYDAEKDELTMKSTTGKIDTRMKNSKGDDLTALDLTVSTKEDSDEEDYRGRKVSGTVLSDDSEDSSAGAKKKAPAEVGTQPIKHGT